MYIVTGATGHIGNNVVRYLLSKHEDVRVLIRKMDESLSGLNVDMCISSHFDEDFFNNTIHEEDIVIHCAAYIDLMNGSLLHSFRTNVQMTKHLLNVSTKKRCRFVYLSSVDIIPKHRRGVISEPFAIDESSHKSYYKTSKAVATNLVLKAINQGLNGIVLYPSAVIGIHDYKPSAAGREILYASTHKVLFLLKGGYNFIDVEDVARAIYIASKSDICDHIILSAHDMTIKNLYKKIASLTRRKKMMIPIPVFLVRLIVLFSKKYSQMMISTIQENYHYDQTKMRLLLQLTPKPIDDTFKETIAWLEAHYA